MLQTVWRGALAFTSLILLELDADQAELQPRISRITRMARIKGF